MRVTTLIKSLFFVGFSLFVLPVYASDTAKEKRWAEQVVDSLMVGEAQWLKAGKSQFLGLYTESATAETRGAAIVLHGSGVHPNWDQVVRPLRSELPDYGWATLSIQMPVLPNEASYAEYASLFPEVAPRIDAAVRYLKNKGINNIVIIAHSLGASMGAWYLAQKPDRAVRGFVAIGASGRLMKNDKVDFLVSLQKITLPVLDIYGGHDLDSVLSTADARRQVARKSGNKNYIQVKIPGASHFFDNKNDILVRRIRGWLKKMQTARK